MIEKTPYEVWKGAQPNLTHTRNFDNEAFLHIPKDQREKVDSKSVKSRFVGFYELQKNYLLKSPVTQKVLISRDVIFNEDYPVKECRFLNSVSEGKQTILTCLSSPCFPTDEEESN